MKIRIKNMVTTDSLLFVEDDKGNLWQYSLYHDAWSKIPLPSEDD